MNVIVLGAGPNGLAAAILLKRAGHGVTILESRAVPGGLAAGAPVLGGPAHQGVLHDSHLVRPAMVKRLGLRLSWQAEPDVPVRAEVP